MTHDDAFLQAIGESPDDVPRLVYADWLDDHGQPQRAEFIRVQIELALVPKDDPRRAGLEARERALLAEHEREWTEPLPRAVLGRTFERGFLASVRLPVRGFSHLPGVLASFPTVRHLHLAGPFRNGKPSMQVVASSPCLARLSSLEISDGYYAVGPEAVRTLAWSPNLGGLAALALHDNAIGDGGLAAIAGSPHLRRLSTLSLSCYGFNPADFIGVAGVRALASSSLLARLTTLRLAGCGLGDEACEVLAAAGSLAGLHTLDLRSNPVSGPLKARLRARLGDRVLL